MKTLIRILADGSLLSIALIGFLAGAIWLKKTTRSIRLQRLPLAAMAGLTSLFTGKMMSVFYQPDSARPFVVQGTEAGAAFINNPGFPSDHALLAVVIVLAVYFVTPYKKVALMLAVFVVLMCIARVLALVHTPVDVIGGCLAGLVGGSWYLKLKKAPAL